MSPLVRRQLAIWARRYRATGAVLVVLGLVLVAFPSVAPGIDGPMRPAPVDVAAGPVGERRSTAAPSPTFSPGRALPLDPGAGPLLSVPDSELDALAPLPPAPDAVATPCPVDLGVEASSEPLPLADVLNLASPVLPLLGPFVPFAVAGLPVVGPVLPVVTPLLPLGQPVFVTLGPLLAGVAGPLAEYEALLLQPIEEPVAGATPAMLEAEQQFLAQLRPLLEQVESTGFISCGVVLTASLAGLVAEVQQVLALDGLVLRVQDLLQGIL